MEIDLHPWRRFLERMATRSCIISYNLRLTDDEIVVSERVFRSVVKSNHDPGEVVMLLGDEATRHLVAMRMPVATINLDDVVKPRFSDGMLAFLHGSRFKP